MIFRNTKSDYCLKNDVKNCDCLTKRKAFELLKKEINKNKQFLASEQCKDTGKTIKYCLIEIDRCLFIIDLLLKNEDENKIFEVKEDYYDCIATEMLIPIGRVLAFTPVSSPYSSIIHKLCAAILYGNQIFWKPSPEASNCSVVLYEIINNTVNKYIKNAVNIILIENNKVEKLLKIDFFDCLLFTGSSNIAKIIKPIIGRKRAVFETGSCAMAYISQYTNFDLSILTNKILDAAFAQDGKRCIALKNLFINEKIFDKMISLIKTKVSEIYNLNIYYGNSDCLMSEEKVLNNTELLRNLNNLIENNYSIIAKRKDNLPIILYDNNSKTKSINELFGAVLCIHCVNSLADISDEYYNVSTLSSTIYSNKDNEINEFVSRCCNCGTICINFGPNKRFDSLPFGGYSNENENKESLQSLKYILTKQQYIIKNKIDN